ncbi:MAG: hypothetical protein WBG82_11445 [Parvibaculum sp.]|uniref:hypothetical protein n=1 Tax=Parvibaculum sp. TaxID=2024848 RepID=UPI003C7536CB
MRTLDELMAGYRAELISPVDEAGQALVERLIAPNGDAILRDMLALRAETDRFMLGRIAAAKPDDEGIGPRAAYPVSYCLEITRRMLHLMGRAPAPAHMTGLGAIQEFARAGGVVKRVWGTLRDTYFQNAIQVGNYYLDVANDTVNPKKDKIELLPMAEANFRSVENFFEFQKVGRGYWESHMIPNRHFPNLAPYFPVITFSRRGVIRLDSANAFMFPMNIEKGFEPAREFVLGGEVSGGAEPYVEVLARLAALDPRMSDPSSLLWFTKVADRTRLEESFVRVRGLGRAALEADVQRVLGVDPILGKGRAAQPALH